MRLTCRVTSRALTSGRWPRPQRGRAPAFTLIEFVVVIALLASLMALVAPRLAGSIRRRNLEQEAARLVALTEFGRDQAVSQGVPMEIWLDSETSWFGLRAQPGWPARPEAPVEFQLSEDVQFDLGRSPGSTEIRTIIAFAPDGYLEAESIPELWLRDRSDSTLAIVRMTNDWGYEVLNEADYADRLRMPRR